MILDNFSGLSAYVALNPLFNEVVEFLKENDLAALPLGKHAIKGDDVFVNVMESKGKTVDEARVESHQKMIDIQVLLSGRERQGYVSGETLSQAEYDAEKDICFHPEKATSFVDLLPGQMAIYFPLEGHQPCISDAPMRKAVFKVRK
ncbi:MAG: YhcH/YjgK/YiaL family protein [Bacteroidaceae bacterium]|nr:YhcH/YjgK/YiaL family protein [Bacteroidaceae bacterium]